jgi:hypothetical protein
MTPSLKIELSSCFDQTYYSADEFHYAIAGLRLIRTARKTPSLWTLRAALTYGQEFDFDLKSAYTLA